MTSGKDRQKLLQLDQGVLRYLLCELKHIGDESRIPITKPSFDLAVGYLSAFYIILGIAAAGSNVIFIGKILKMKLYQNYIYGYLSLLSVINLISVLISLPLSFITQVTYWKYGSFLCRNMPLIQEVFVNMAFLTPALLAIERFKQITKEERRPCPVWLGFIGLLTLSGLCAFPGCFFITFFSTKEAINLTPDVQVCLVHTEEMEEYARAMLILLYITPVLMVAFYFVKISLYLNSRESDDEQSTHIHQEKQTQKYISILVLATALCWLPLNMSTVAQFVVVEGCDFRKLDIIYCFLVWIAFAHTLCTPLIGIRMIGRREVEEIVRYQNLLATPGESQQDGSIEIRLNLGIRASQQN